MANPKLIGATKNGVHQGIIGTAPVIDYDVVEKEALLAALGQIDTAIAASEEDIMTLAMISKARELRARLKELEGK